MSATCGGELRLGRVLCYISFLAISQCGSVSFGLMKLHNHFQLLHNYWNVSVLTGSGERGVGRGNWEKERSRTLGPEQPHCYAAQRAVKFSWRSLAEGACCKNEKRKWNAIFQYNANNKGNQKFIGADRRTNRDRRTDRQTEKQREGEREIERDAQSRSKGSLWVCVLLLFLSLKHETFNWQVAANCLQHYRESHREKSGERRVEGGDCVARRQLAACGRHTLATN